MNNGVSARWDRVDTCSVAKKRYLWFMKSNRRYAAEKIAPFYNDKSDKRQTIPAFCVGCIRLCTRDCFHWMRYSDLWKCLWIISTWMEWVSRTDISSFAEGAFWKNCTNVGFRLVWIVYEFMMTFPFGICISTMSCLNLCLSPTRHNWKLSAQIFRKLSSNDMFTESNVDAPKERSLSIRYKRQRKQSSCTGNNAYLHMAARESVTVVTRFARC